MANSGLVEEKVVEPFRFSLVHAFRLTTMVCIYCALIKACGHYPAMMFLALIVLLAALQIIRIRGLVFGSLAGSMLAAILTVVCAVVCGRQDSAEFIISLFLAPVFGYLIGMSFAAYEQSRLGI